MTRALAVLTVLAVPAVVFADPAPDRSTIDLLILQLGSPRYADREAAGRALEAAGPSAIPALEAAARSGSPEVRRRATGHLAKLRRQHASAEHLGVTTVRLDYKNTPLGAALADLKARTGINLTLAAGGVENPLRPVTCRTADLPPWEAVEALCAAAGLREVFADELPVPKDVNRNRRGYITPPPPPPSAGQVPVTLADGTHHQLPGSRSTAVRVVALPKRFPLHRAALGTGDITLHFDVTPTPGLNWDEAAGVRVTKLIDDAGRYGSGGTLRQPDVSPFLDDPFGGGMVVMGGGRVVAMRWDASGNPVYPDTQPNPRIVPVPLKVATPSARSLRLLEGVVICRLTLPDQPLVTITAGTSGEVKGDHDTSAFVVDSAEQPGGRMTVRVQVRSPSPWASGRANPWGGPLWPVEHGPRSSTRITARDADGNPLTAVTSGMTQMNDDGQTVTTEWQVTYQGRPARYVVMGPKPELVEVPFRMENVPLP